MGVQRKKDGVGWDLGSRECALRKCAGKGNGSLETQENAASWKVSEEKVSRRSNCIQFCKESEDSQDWEIVTDVWLSGTFGRAGAAGWWLGRGRGRRRRRAWERGSWRPWASMRQGAAGGRPRLHKGYFGI